MGVTEFALVKLKSGINHLDDLEFLDTLMACQETQDEFMHEHQPLCIDHGSNLSNMYIRQPCDPSKGSPEPTLLITAPWESPEAHAEWMQSAENKDSMRTLQEYIEPGDDSVLLFHMDAAGAEGQIKGEFLALKDVNTCRITVEEKHRKALQEKYSNLEARVLEKHGEKQKVWAGWRIEKEEGLEELVVFWSDDLCKEKIRDLTESCRRADFRCFRHIV